MTALPRIYPFSRNSNDGASLKTMNSRLLALAAAVALTASPAQASNLLVNPGFESPPSGQTVASGWTYFAPPTLSTNVHDYWVANQVTGNGMLPHSGTFFWKQWTAQYGPTNNVAGLGQTFSSAPGSIYQASGWLSSSSSDAGGLGAGCVTWIQVEFLDASTNVLALYKSPNFSASVGLNAWFPYSVTNTCDLTQPVSTGDPYFTTYAVTGSVSQLVAPFGTAVVRYRYAYLAVGTNEVGSAFLDDAVLNQVSGPVPPVINNLFPQDKMIFVNPSNGVSFNASSASGFTINNSGIHLVLNGTDVSGSLAISGSSSNKNVTYSGLQSNMAYTVSITVTDSFNLTVSANTYFETTWVGVQPVTYLWEAEDWDFANGIYIDNPDLCSAPGDPNCYFGKVGVANVDEYNLSGASGPYRSGDPMGQAPSGDYLRPNLFAAGRIDYCINPFNYSEWVNYTRDWPNSTNWIVARLATGASSGSVTLSQITPTATNNLGTFTINGGLGWTTFENVYLKDTNGNNVNVILNGTATLRVTSYPGGNLLPNFFMLVAAQADLPLLSNVYPTGTHPFEYTNAFSFTVTASGSSFPANGIRLNLDGNDVSSNLVITGSASTKNVVYPFLPPNAIHVAIMAVTNVLGHGILVTNRFDTFSEANYMVEAEDFDYDSGQYITNWFPNAYYVGNELSPAVTNIDFQHISLAGELPQYFEYRAVGIPQDYLLTHDYLRPSFYGFYDLVLVYFAGTDWANYTRQYPAGSFYFYIRSSGDGPFSMYLDQVVSGAGTVNQVTKRLGHFGGFGKSPVYITYDWAPLTDDGLVAPALVNLNGVTTLRLTTDGNCNPNYFMLVPAAGITLTAAQSASQIVLSFPTQTGVNYRVFYRTNLTTGNWTLLTAVLGNGAIKSVSDPLAGNSRFYKVVAP